MIYSVWLFFLSLAFVAIERLWPRSPDQPALRRGIVSDLVYLVFNAEYLGLLLGIAATHIIRWFDALLDEIELLDLFYRGVMSRQSVVVQFVVLLVVFDLAQWGIHNLLHRVPILWRFHKVHHSIVEMDWIGNWRFHWMEIVVYRTALYPLAAFLGFGVPAMFWYGVFNTLIGHFAHANLRWRTGLLKYLINTPELHIWHHTHPESGPVNRNFAITLSVWDWLFGTAYAPACKDPSRLGFDGVEKYPANVVGQTAAPFLPRQTT